MPRKRIGRRLFVEMDEGRRCDRTAECEPSAPMRRVPVADTDRGGKGLVLEKSAFTVWGAGRIIEVRV